jgi:xanthine dehydrogenase accessory factor
VGETPDDEKGICGGSVEFLIETFDGTALPLFQELSAQGGSDEGGVLVSILSTGGSPRKMRLRNVARQSPIQFPQEIAAAIQDVAASGRAGVRLSAEGADVFVESLAVPPTVVLFGAGHVSSHIARYARSVHFRVAVCDDRPEYANRERFPDADEIVVEDFPRAFDRLRIDAHSYLVIVTRGHQHDGIVLEQAVRTGARYIGMIGSKRKTLTLLERLRDQGVSKERIDRVYAPIGIAIGALTAEEIALSVVCELVKVRRLGDEAGIGHMSLSRREADA